MDKPAKTGIIRDEKGRFPKGVSGHPEGRTVGSGLSLTTEMKRKLAEVPKGSKASNLEMLIEKIFDMALKEKNEQIIKQIWNYIDGMPKQSNDITSNGQTIEPVLVKFLKGEDNRDSK